MAGATLPRSRKSANPFFVLLVVIGVAFVVTAMSFWVMSLNRLEAASAAPGGQATPHPLLAWLEAHGMTALVVELVLLAACTVGAIGTDDYWQRRAARRKDK